MGRRKQERNAKQKSRRNLKRTDAREERRTPKSNRSTRITNRSAREPEYERNIGEIDRSEEIIGEPALDHTNYRRTYLSYLNTYQRKNLRTYQTSENIPGSCHLPAPAGAGQARTMGSSKQAGQVARASQDIAGRRYYWLSTRRFKSCVYKQGKAKLSTRSTMAYGS